MALAIGGTDAAYSAARAARLTAELLAQPAPPAAPYVAPAWERPGPDGQPAAAWPYVSTRLGVHWLPNCPLWAGEAVSLGTDAAPPSVYHRLSPTVLHWLTLAGRVLEDKFAAGRIERQQCDLFADTMEVLYQFAARHIDPDACLQAARADRPELTGHGGPR